MLNLLFTCLFYQGMTYIHDSALRSHGNLKSSNCLVDSRWVVKVTDFGLHELKYGADPEPEGALDFEQQCESEFQCILQFFFPIFGMSIRFQIKFKLQRLMC